MSLAVVETTTDSYDQLVAGDYVQTANVLITTGKAYTRGDLLTFTPGTNVVDLAAAGTIGNARFIMADTITSAQATAHAAAGRMLQVYAQGEFHATGLRLAGVALTAPQIVSARGALNQAGIQVR